MERFRIFILWVARTLPHILNKRLRFLQVADNDGPSINHERKLEI